MIRPKVSGGRGFRASSCRLAALLVALGGGMAWRAEPAASRTGTARALIVVGLPGNEEHTASFAELVGKWKACLTGPLGFDPAEVRILGDKEVGGRVPATREAVEAEVSALRRATRADDRLWVFWLGHANIDDEHAFLHLPGPDLRDDQFGALFRGIEAREQVFWMTSACSGWLVRPVSAKGRIVIAATERDREINETEFPEALAAAMASPPAKLDANKDAKVSVLELYRAAVDEVAARFSADKRVPTEHAQLDDDGDGAGTDATSKTPGKDGSLAARTFLSSSNEQFRRD